MDGLDPGLEARLSAEPLHDMTDAALDGALPIIGVGGIMSADDAKAKIDAGATLVQLYTGLIYRGSELIAECARALAEVRAPDRLRG